MQATGLQAPATRAGRGITRGRALCVAPRATATMEPSTSTSSAPSSTQFLRKHILKLAPYTPIEPFEVLSSRYNRKPEDIIKLDANENPYGPPPEVREALATMPFPHIYPDPETRALRRALAEMHNIPMENLLVRYGAAKELDPISQSEVLEAAQYASRSKVSMCCFGCLRKSGARVWLWRISAADRGLRERGLTSILGNC